MRCPTEEQHSEGAMKVSSEEVMWARPVEEVTPAGVTSEIAGQEVG